MLLFWKTIRSVPPFAGTTCFGGEVGV